MALGATSIRKLFFAGEDSKGRGQVGGGKKGVLEKKRGQAARRGAALPQVL